MKFVVPLGARPAVHSSLPHRSLAHSAEAAAIVTTAATMCETGQRERKARTTAERAEEWQRSDSVIAATAQ